MRAVQRILQTAVLGLLLTLNASARTGGGWVEDRGTGTVIHVKIFELPDPTRTDASTRSEAAIVRAFVKAFPTLFAERHAARAKADPVRYGRHNWDDVRVELFQATGAEFIEAKLAERAERHKRQGGQRYVLEPNVKEGKGGLRDLHLLFDEQATQILGTTDLIAERVRKNGAATLRSIGDVSRRQSIKDDDATSVTADAMVRTLAEDNRTLLVQLKDVKAAAEAEGDIATSGLVDAWADETQQRIWFLEATAGY